MEWDYCARFYSPMLNRFIQPDTMFVDLFRKKNVSFNTNSTSTIQLCTCCLSDNINIYSMPKPIDVKGNYQSTVTVGITVLYNFGRTIDYQSIPFNYTFPHP
ncbi:MAG: hypothetical protein UZ14_CFX002000231 [Chloroflexi bacterium OLB14]|nr:MAG: hypothetical protein UZ14_CFX002000231 [Chloroflexi bacterium OLB14]